MLDLLVLNRRREACDYGCKKIEKLTMIRFLTLLLIVFITGCSIRPYPQYTRSRPVPSRKENKGFQRKQNERKFSDNSKDDLQKGFDKQQDLRTRFAMEVQRFMGAPYVWGGASPAGTDCSGLVRTVFRRALGIDLPHSAQQLYEYGRPVAKEELQLGDLVFFREPYGSKISHVGIYLDQGQFVHASLSAGVTLSDINSSWYSRIYIGARRVLDDDVFEETMKGVK